MRVRLFHMRLRPVNQIWLFFLLNDWGNEEPIQNTKFKPDRLYKNFI